VLLLLLDAILSGYLTTHLHTVQPLLCAAALCTFSKRNTHMSTYTESHPSSSMKLP
jgi:hypothetical protein